MGKIDTIIVMGAGIEKASDISANLVTAIRQQYGQDVIILSKSEANEKGILEGTLPSVSEFKFTMPPRIDLKENFFDPHQAKNDCKKGWKNNRK